MTLKHVVGGMAFAFGIGPGCTPADTQITGGPSELAGEVASLPAKGAEGYPAAVESSIQESLAQLRGLQLFAVGQLVLDLPEEATAFYGMPLPGSEWVAPYEHERARQAPRLAVLAAEAARRNADVTLCYQAAPSSSELATALQALSDLRIVTIGGLIETAPKNNSQCYNLPCEEDVRAAREENDLRSAKTVGLAAVVAKAAL